MGKTKTKYPVGIVLYFFLPINDKKQLEKIVNLTVHSSPLTYQHIQKPYEQFLNQFNINYRTQMITTILDQYQLVNEQFQIDISKILQCDGHLPIMIKNSIQFQIERINQEIESIFSSIEQIQQRIKEIPTRQQISLNRQTSVIPALHHNQSAVEQTVFEERKIDLGVLFSQPVFDEVNKKPAMTPVDFRSQIQRLHLALKTSIKPNITLKCEIATKQNLKHLIKYSKPKILHIICHGTSAGTLQFQDDSRTVLGALQSVESEEIVQALRNYQQSLPDIVFINSCYSQKIGQIFAKMGVSYVISIDSEDTIEDEAAQIFSEHFYRNIFSGQRVREAFDGAQKQVQLKHQNFFNCCCRHTSKEQHKPNCRWIEMIKFPGEERINQRQKNQKHKLFHVPSDLCKCVKKNLNQHNSTCQWAKQTLFQINNDFRIKDLDGTFRYPKTVAEWPKNVRKDQLHICCCYNYQLPSSEKGQQPKRPHSESNKFKMKQSSNQQKPQIIFQIIPSPYKQLIDLTAPQLVQTHEKIESSIMGRQKQIYQFMKKIKDLNQSIYIVHGPVGVGRTSFVLKCVTYLIQRKVYQNYFYIDLYGIKDKDIFRYKFNQVTKFNYDGQVKVNDVINKMMIIILDNADDFFQLQRDQMYDELKFLRKQLHKSKIILTLKEENCLTFDFEKIHSEKFGLEPLSIFMATKLLFSKMRHLFDVSVQYLEVDSLVRSNQSLRIPKIIESVCQAFNTNATSKKKIKVSQIKKKLQTIFEGDTSGNGLIQETLMILKAKSQASYQLLLFISQFSEGVSIDDFKMLSLYAKKGNKINLPIGKNWEQVFSTLFQKFQLQDPQKQGTQTESIITEDSDLANPPLKNAYSMNINPVKQTLKQTLQNQRTKAGDKIFKGQSYFLDEISQNRFIVKRFIRDFIWKKHESPSNYYMKHIFVGYMAVMLEVYFKWLVSSKYIHQDLIQHSSASQAGIFGFKNNVFNNALSLTQSVRIASEYKSQFERIISQHPTIIEKIQKSDPSIFIANHKQDFLNIYEKRWDIVFRYLKQNKKIEDKICMGYLENLAIFIPTAFKIAKVQSSLLKYVISKSMGLLGRLQKYSQDQKYQQNQKILSVQLKLQLMKASIDIQKVEGQSLKLDLDFNKQFTVKMVKTISDPKILEFILIYWNFERTYMLMYKEYISRKENVNRTSLQKNKISFDKLKVMIQNLYSWLAQKWDQSQQILFAKRNLIIGLTYLIILKNNSGGVGTHANAVKLKKQHQTTILKLLNQSEIIFKNRLLMKLCLKTKLVYVEISIWKMNSIKKSKIQLMSKTPSNVYEQLTQMQNKAIQCQKIYTDRKNNLIVYAQFQNQIKNLKRFLKEKLWEQSSNTLVCMRPVPLTIKGESPIIQNLARKKNRFRKEIQNVVNRQIDLCSKFQILTKSKLKQEVQNGCTMLLISANIKIQNNVPSLVFQGSRLQEDLVQINKKFTEQYDLSKIKILMIAGRNSSLAIEQLAKILQDPPFMISLGNVESDYNMKQFSQFAQKQQKPNDYILLEIQQRRKTQIAFLRQFVKRLMERQINSKDQIIQICQQCEPIVRNSLQLKIQYSTRKSSIQIQHKKGSYKDLSPGYQKNHNIDMKIQSSDTFNFICLRRWKQTFRVFKYIQSCLQKAIEQNKQPADPVYINIFGEIGSGKSIFIQQIARIFVQRQKYTSGVYIIDGKLLQKKYQGQFESYFNKQSQVGKIMTLDDFQTNGNEKMMLIIDDFHLIKPRSNGRFILFLKKIVEKRVNLIIVTNEDLNKQNKKEILLIFKRIKPIKIDRLCLFEIDLIAYNTLDLRNKRLLEKYQELKRQKQGDIRVNDIYQIKGKFAGKKKQHSFSVDSNKELKKMQSNQN